LGIPNESPEAAVGISFKKTALAGEQERPGIARKRARRKARPGSIDLKRLGFIDETRARTDMAPLRGRARGAGGRPGARPSDIGTP